MGKVGEPWNLKNAVTQPLGTSGCVLGEHWINFTNYTRITVHRLYFLAVASNSKCTLCANRWPASITFH